MISLTPEKFKLLSFPDESVTKFQYNRNIDEIVFELSGAYLDTDPLTIFNQAIIKISDWSTFTVRCYNSNTDTWNEIENIEEDSITMISEFEYTETILCLRGFGKKGGCWMEYTFENFKLEVNVTY